MPIAKGTVYRWGSDERIQHASVKATNKVTRKVEHTTTDDDGDFEFDLASGTWTLMALHEKSLPKSVELLLEQDTEGLRIELQRLQDTTDASQGMRFWYALLISLGVLIVLYIGLHIVFPRQPVPLSAALPGLITKAQEQVDKAEKTSGNADLLVTVAEIGSDVGVLAKGAGLGTADKTAVTGLVDEIEAAIQADRQQDARAGLATLSQLLQPVSNQTVGLWDRDPWRLLEVLMWGLAGVLVHKIIIAGWYLRANKFYREGIVMHIGHIITTPLLVLVAVLLLSLATLSITLASGNQLTLDLSDPRILVAVSFLLGTSPWPLWNFIEDTAKRVTGRGE